MDKIRILEEFLKSRGFSNVRTSGKVLDAAAVYGGRQHAFKTCECERAVNIATFSKPFIIKDPAPIRTCYNFSTEIGYSSFCAVVFHPNSVISMVDINSSVIEDFDTVGVSPRSFWKYRDLVGELIFIPVYKEELHLRKKKLEDLFIVCNGLRYKRINGKDEGIECLMRGECKRYMAWLRYSNAKDTGCLDKIFYPRDLKHITPIVHRYTTIDCKDFKKKINLQEWFLEQDKKKCQTNYF